MTSCELKIRVRARQKWDCNISTSLQSHQCNVLKRHVSFSYEHVSFSYEHVSFSYEHVSFSYEHISFSYEHVSFSDEGPLLETLEFFVLSHGSY